MKKSLYILLIALLLVGVCGNWEPMVQIPTPASLTSTPPIPTSTQIEIDGSIPTLVLVGTLIDGSGADPLPDAALVIQDERIVAVGPKAELSIPPEAQVIELTESTILPGFINTHVHNAYVAYNLKTWAQAGVTTVRDLGEKVGWPYFAARDRLNADPKNARVISAGPLVTVPGGYPIAGNNFPSLTVESPEDARQKIEELIDDGAEVIKITLTSGHAPSLSPEEAAVIVESAHARGIPVTAHATTAEDLRRALDAGVDDIAHMAVDRVADSDIRRMVEADVSWVPTFEPLENRGLTNLRRFIEAGGRVALGNDSGYLPGIEMGMPMREIQAMQDAGMTPMEIILAATRDAAYVCRRLDILGTLEVGKYADVLIVEGNPLQDLSVLDNVQLVVHSGTVIRGQTFLTPTVTPEKITEIPSITPLPQTPESLPQPATDTDIRILFIGNSHTFMNDLAGMFAELALSGGHKVSVESSAKGGYTLEQHARDDDTLEKLEGNDWDFVILQESTRNSIDESLRETQMIPAVRELDEKIRSRGAQTVVLQMWASIAAVEREGLAHFASEQRRLTEALRESFQELDVFIAPVGSAWVESLSQRPDLELWGSDSQHASMSGTYLMACILYATIFQHSPVGLSFTANLPEKTALFLQEIAEETLELLCIQCPVDVTGHSMGGISPLALAIEPSERT